MTRVTRFAARDPGPAARVTGFLSHLRCNGLQLGVAEAQFALTALTHVNSADPEACRHALRAVCTGCAEEAESFDALFDSYWLNDGRVVKKVMPNPGAFGPNAAGASRMSDGIEFEGTGDSDGPDRVGSAADSDGDGRLAASRAANYMKTDLRRLVQRADIEAAQAIAANLGAALRDRRSRRRRAARSGGRVDMHRVVRLSLSTGGEPFRLMYRKRPDRPVKIVAICDVSGSMGLYSRVFISFLVGLMRADSGSDAYLFHTRLVRITDALHDKDSLRSLARVSILAEGFGGGSKIGTCLKHFSRTYARRFVDARTVVMILSDGYDTGPPKLMVEALTALKKRNCKIIWLNPLKGWDRFEPVAAGMRAALPYLNLFCPANTLDDLASLEPELVRL